MLPLIFGDVLPFSITKLLQQAGQPYSLYGCVEGSLVSVTSVLGIEVFAGACHLLVLWVLMAVVGYLSCIVECGGCIGLVHPEQFCFFEQCTGGLGNSSFSCRESIKLLYKACYLCLTASRPFGYPQYLFVRHACIKWLRFVSCRDSRCVGACKLHGVS